MLVNLSCSRARGGTTGLDAGGAMTPRYDIGQQDIGQQDIVFFGPFSDGKAILIPRPYEPQISWKSNIP